MGKIGRNEPCPCGSGRKFKNCCAGKGFSYQEDASGQIGKVMPLGEDAASALQMLREDFIARHGREPSPGDRVFDRIPSAEWMEHQMAQAMEKAGVDPALIYAYTETGLMLSEQNEDKATGADVDEFEAALDAYEAEHGVQVIERRFSRKDLEGMMRFPPKGL